MLAIFVAILAIQMMCEAEPENISIGLYNISFDLNQPCDEYRIATEGPIESESLSGKYERIHTLKIECTDDDTYGIVLMLKELNNSNNDLARTDQKNFLEKAYPDALLVEKRDISEDDCGSVAKILSSNGMEYVAIFHPSFNSIQKIKLPKQNEKLSALAILISSYPWDKGTLQLLKTIHIERSATG